MYAYMCDYEGVKYCGSIYAIVCASVSRTCDHAGIDVCDCVYIVTVWWKCVYVRMTTWV